MNKIVIFIIIVISNLYADDDFRVTTNPVLFFYPGIHIAGEYGVTESGAITLDYSEMSKKGATLTEMGFKLYREEAFDGFFLMVNSGWVTGYLLKIQGLSIWEEKVERFVYTLGLGYTWKFKSGLSFTVALPYSIGDVERLTSTSSLVDLGWVF